ncbi:MAG: hypothetical protein ACJ79A_05505 [Gemmatimonadaceae bacterium]
MRRLLAMFALATLAACGDNSSTGPVTVNLVGNWKLQSVNGSALPYSQTTSTGKFEVFDGSTVISSTGSFTMNVTQRTTATNGSSSISTVTTFGTVEISGSSVIFKRQDIPNDPGTTAELTSDTFALTQNGLALVFVKL